MRRCEKCSKFSGEMSQPKVGDIVDFTIVRGNGRSKRISVRTGKLFLIKADGYSVIYRGTVYHSDEVSCANDPSPLTLAFVGLCECKLQGGDHA